MAEPADIALVKDLLPPEAHDEGWNEEKVGVYLDGGYSKYQAVALYWESKASRLYQMIDISESGSSRSLSKIYENAKGLAEYWRDRDAQEKLEAEKAQGYTRIHKVTRV